MKTEKSSLQRLTEACLPDSIFVCFEPFETDIKKDELDLLESQSGRLLIKKMSDLFLESDEIKIFTKKNEKPKAHCEGEEVSVSFSHTTDGVAGTVSKQFNVGCDIEHANRNVHSKLVDRMKHENELESFYEQTDAIRIWTLKEAALKMIGTGLRKPMNSVWISTKGENRFAVQFDDGKKAKICSFGHKDHWISVCYQPLHA
ncbi:MAG: 4'-phosphopantetheinyl transferase superfamily protein [Balneolaceae bacterium]|nr:4'-phosphopantetheinyl transferase superfamily protein [Balneolaceae bacterium]